MFIYDNKYKKIIRLLDLDKPLVILDIETTGLVIYKDKIIEIAYIKIWPDGRMKKDGMVLNPEIPITRESSAIHGYTRKDVADKPTFRQKAQELWDTLYDCYYGGYNVVYFDLPILRREFVRVGMDFEYRQEQIIDSRIIYQTMVRRTLSAAYKYYFGKEYKHAHGAMSDATAAADILIKQLEKYNEVRDWDFLRSIHDSFYQEEFKDELFLYTTRKFNWQKGEAYFAFSKYKGKSLSEVAQKDPGFLKWMLKAEFSDKVKTVVQKAFDERKRGNNNK